MADDTKKQQADAQFRKLQRAEDGKKAMAEYEAGISAVRDKTAKLRELRLAREAAEAAAAPAAPAKKRAVKKGAKKEKAPTGKLSDWLDDQQASGRNS